MRGPGIWTKQQVGRCKHGERLFQCRVADQIDCVQTELSDHCLAVFALDVAVAAGEHYVGTVFGSCMLRDFHKSVRRPVAKIAASLAAARAYDEGRVLAVLRAERPVCLAQRYVPAKRRGPCADEPRKSHHSVERMLV